MNESSTSRYPLGTDRTEFERLHFQHRLWSDAAHALWRRAGIVPGACVLDIGAGPGAASFDLASLVTSAGRVVAIDESESFVAHIKTEARERNFPQLSALTADVHRLDSLGDAPVASFDLAYARWVLCFVARPRDVLRSVHKWLKPGGAICIHDYFNYETMTPAPRRVSYTEVVAATAKSWREEGGDPDVVGRLPALLHDEGFILEHIDVHQRVARPGDTMWHWAITWWNSYAPKLVERGFIPAATLEQFRADIHAMTRERDFLVLPPVYELLARRR